MLGTTADDVRYQWDSKGNKYDAGAPKTDSKALYTRKVFHKRHNELQSEDGIT